MYSDAQEQRRAPVEDRCEKRLFGALSYLKQSFCQDRLGTSTGKAEKKSCSAGVKIAVVGPGSVTQAGMVGPYFGDDICYRPEETLKNRVYDW